MHFHKTLEGKIGLNDKQGGLGCGDWDDRERERKEQATCYSTVIVSFQNSELLFLPFVVGVVNSNCIISYSLLMRFSCPLILQVYSSRNIFTKYLLVEIRCRFQ